MKNEEISITTILMNRGQIRAFLHRIAESECVFSDGNSFGWGLSSILCAETVHFIEKHFGYLN